MQRCPSCGFQFEGSPAESAEPGYTPAGAAESTDAGAPVTTAGPIERIENLEVQFSNLAKMVAFCMQRLPEPAPAEQPAPAEAPQQ